MKVLVIGAGAREHALAVQLAAESGTAVVCAPGNPGIARDVPVQPVDPNDPDAVLALAERVGADLTVIGPEAPLAAGVADRFLRAGRPVFGPTQAAAQLETSKAFAKGVMERHRVPTATAIVCDTLEQAVAALASERLGWPVVVKADGLAAGKGVVIAADRIEAEAAVRAAMIDGAFGAAGARVVLEECLTGEELSYFVIAAGERFVACGSAQDHKRLLDGDHGPNTGGMGAFAPSVLLTDGLRERIESEVVAPVLAGMAAEGTPFVGFLYCGLMLTAAGPKVIEFNCRFGDPEAQVVLPLLAEPLAPLLLAASTTGNLPERALFADDVAVGVVLAARGYPAAPETGQVIDGLEQVATHHPGVQVRFAGVAERDGQLVTAGGRVLTVVGRAGTYAGRHRGRLRGRRRHRIRGAAAPVRHRCACRPVRARTAMKYAVVTFGCRVNQADSLAVEAALTSAGAEAVSADRADVVLVNTCSVTASADQGARQTIRRIHRENPTARIVVTGCFASRAGAEVAALPGVEMVVPNPDKPRLAARLLPMLAADLPGEGPCGRTPGPGLMGRTAWTLRAQTGCDEPCSYCIIPTTRGRSQSRPLADILMELRRVVAVGYKEVALTGVHLGAWGRDLQPGTGRLADLLQAMAGEAGDLRIRVSSLEPMDCTAEVLDVIAGAPHRFAAHLHLPLQHAAERILTAMRRPYSGGSVQEPRGRGAAAGAGRRHRLGCDRGLPGRDRRRLRHVVAFSRSLAAHAPARVPLLRSPRHRCRGAAGQGARGGGEGASPATAHRLARARRAFPRLANWAGPPGADHRRRAGGGHRQLPARRRASRTQP